MLFLYRENKRQSGVEVGDSARETLSVGADVYYRLARISLTATYLLPVILSSISSKTSYLRDCSNDTLLPCKK